MKIERDKNCYGFKFNENGVCLNPVKVEIVPAKDRRRWWIERAMIEIARNDKGQYIYGYHWSIDTVINSCPCCRDSRRTFDSQDSCILDYIGRLEQRLSEISKYAVRKEWDDNGDEVTVDNSKKYRRFLKELAVKKDYYALPRLF